MFFCWLVLRASFRFRLNIENVPFRGVKSKGTVGYPWESTRDIYQHVPPIYGLYNCFMGQYGVMFWQQLPGYLPKGTQNFPLIKARLGQVNS